MACTFTVQTGGDAQPMFQTGQDVLQIFLHSFGAARQVDDERFAADDCRAEEAALKLAGIETAAVLLNLHQTVPGRRLFEKETRVVRNAAEIPLALLDVLRDWRRRHP